MTSAIASPSRLTPGTITQSTPVRHTSGRWILHPMIDLTFCRGGLLCLLMAVHYLVAPGAFQSGPSIVEPFPLLGLLGTMLLADTHNMATLVQLYRNRERRNRLWFVSYAGGACCIGLGIFALLSPAVAAVAARLYLVFIVQHVIAQTYGLLLLYCEKRDYLFSSTEGLISGFSCSH